MSSGARAGVKKSESDHLWTDLTSVRSQPKNFGGTKMYDFMPITLFCLEKRLSKHKMTIFPKIFWGAMAPLALLWLRLCLTYGIQSRVSKGQFVMRKGICRL